MGQKRLLRIGIDEYAAQIEFQFSEFFIPYAVGIYPIGEEEPVLVPGETYYRLERLAKGMRMEVPVHYIPGQKLDLQGDIYNTRNEIVLSQHFTRNPNRFLSERPSIPVLGRQLVQAYIDDVVYRIQQFRKPISGNLQLEKVLQRVAPSCPPAHEAMEEFIQDYLTPLKYDIMCFTGTSSWNIFSVSRSKETLIVENMGDFRIADWEQKIGKTFKPL